MPSIKCGHCDLKHLTVQDVKACAQREGIATEPVKSGEDFLGTTEVHKPPSQRQLDYAHSLVRQRVTPPDSPLADLDDDARHEAVNAMTWTEISDFIGLMLKQGKRASQGSKESTVTVSDGIYKQDGVIYKVKYAVHGSGHLYAQRLLVPGVDIPSDERGVWVREPGMLSKLRPESKMSIEAAMEFGRLYGICVRCGAILTKDESIEAGLGTTCITKVGSFA